MGGDLAKLGGGGENVLSLGADKGNEGGGGENVEPIFGEIAENVAFLLLLGVVLWIGGKLSVNVAGRVSFFFFFLKLGRV